MEGGFALYSKPSGMKSLLRVAAASEEILPAPKLKTTAGINRPATEDRKFRTTNFEVRSYP